MARYMLGFTTEAYDRDANSGKVSKTEVSAYDVFGGFLGKVLADTFLSIGYNLFSGLTRGEGPKFFGWDKAPRTSIIRDQPQAAQEQPPPQNNGNLLGFGPYSSSFSDDLPAVNYRSRRLAEGYV
jgi:hypothetical protein